jgi:hypothetical protein
MSPGKDSESSSSSTLLRKGPKPRAAELRTQLAWEEFLGLVGSHKSVAFELDAEIKLGDFPPAHNAQTGDTGEIAKAIAEEVWKASGYRFM